LRTKNLAEDALRKVINLKEFKNNKDGKTGNKTKVNIIPLMQACHCLDLSCSAPQQERSSELGDTVKSYIEWLR
jgi:hypothetical protein